MITKGNRVEYEANDYQHRSLRQIMADIRRSNKRKNEAALEKPKPKKEKPITIICQLCSPAKSMPETEWIAHRKQFHKEISHGGPRVTT